MIDEERDTYPALLALYHPFVRYTHFPVFQSEKYTYRFLGFGVVLTALSRLRGCALNSRFLGVRSGFNGWILPLLHPRFNTFSRGFLAASRRNIQGGDFSLFTLCSIAFLTGTNEMFSPLCRRFTFAGLTCLRGRERDISYGLDVGLHRFQNGAYHRLQAAPEETGGGRRVSVCAAEKR